MDRLEFKQILESIKISDKTSPEEMQKLLRPLNIALLQMIPKRLYRYRSCTEDNIMAFEKDQVWMSTSDLFNDPFDSLIQYDESELRSAIEMISDPDVSKAIAQMIASGIPLPDPVRQIMDSDAMEDIKVFAGKVLENGTVSCHNSQNLAAARAVLGFYIKLLPQIAQRFLSVACFSEKVDSMLMWTHYSSSHTGFALGYNLEFMLLPNEKNLGLYPVVYSDKRYDAQSFLFYLFGKLMKIPVHNDDILGQIKLFLYKSTDWQYEHEWRLLGNLKNNLFQGESRPIELKPNSIFYGCRISDEDYRRLHSIAQSKRLDEYHVDIDNADDAYKMVIHQ